MKTLNKILAISGIFALALGTGIASLKSNDFKSSYADASNFVTLQNYIPNGGYELQADTLYTVSSSIIVGSSTSGKSGFVVKSKTTEKPAILYVKAGVTVTVIGGKGNSYTEGGHAGIKLEKGYHLAITGSGTVITTGGDGFLPSKGENGGNGSVVSTTEIMTSGYGGAGGNGGSGGGAGIGTDGGAGGKGASRTSEVGPKECTFSSNDTDGNTGTYGGNGSSAAPMGDLRLLGSVQVDSTGGKTTSYGAQAGYAGNHGQYKWMYNYAAGAGGAGGGGGAGYPGASVGTGGGGGAGGCSGGSGGLMSSSSSKGPQPLNGSGGLGGAGYVNGNDGGPSTVTTYDGKAGGTGGNYRGVAGDKANTSSGTVYKTTAAQLTNTTDRSMIYTENFTRSDVDNPYSKTLYLNYNTGISNSRQKLTCVYGMTMLKLDIPSVPGRRFLGAWQYSNGTGTQYYDENGLSTVICDKDTPTDIYAKYEVINYTVTVDGNGATNDYTKSVNATYGRNPESISVLPERENRELLGFELIPEKSNEKNTTLMFDQRGIAKTPFYLLRDCMVQAVWSDDYSETATNFVNSYMHLDDYDASYTGSGDGSCRTYFTDAKTAFNSLSYNVREYMASGENRNTLVISGYNRLMEWAKFNDYTLDSAYTLVAKSNESNLTKKSINELATMILVPFVAVTFVGLTVFALKKTKKEEK